MENERKSGKGLQYRVDPDGLVLEKSSPNAHGKVVILEGCIAIEDEVFKGRKGITSIFFPKSLARIGKDAFADCTGLKTVVFEGTYPETDDSFKGCQIDSMQVNQSVDDEEVTVQGFITLTKVGNENQIHLNTKYIALIEPIRLSGSLFPEYGSIITLTIESPEGGRQQVKVRESCKKVLRAIKQSKGD